ncbi:MAG: DUF6428 family protein, partial [Verrucomicrobiota bacterium]
MTFNELKQALGNHPDHSIHFRLPDGESVPVHFHITEVGHTTRKFIDCGGTIREDEKCLLQVWVADDV